MIKFFKRLLKVFLALCVIFILAMAGMMYFVNPNQYKGTIEAKVLEQTGHVLTIKGPISWKWSLTPRLQLEDVNLDNAKPFQNKLLSAEQIRVDLSLTSLLTGKVVLNLKLKGVDIALQKNNAGLANWENLLSAKAGANTSAPKTAPKQDQAQTAEKPEVSTTKNLSRPTVLFNSLQIENAQLSFQDAAKNINYQIKQLDLDMDNAMQALAGIAKPVQLSFQWLNASNQKTGQLSLQADWALNFSKELLDIKNFILKLTLPGDRTTTVKGNISLKEINQNPSLFAELESKQFELQPWLQHLGVESNTALPAAADIKTQLSYQAPYLKAENLDIKLQNNGTIRSRFQLDTTKLAPETLTLQGDFTGKDLQFNQIKLEEVKGKIEGKAGLITIAPLTINIAQSLQQANVQIDLRGSTPKYSINSESQNFEVGQFLELFGVNNKIQGKTNYKLNLRSTGSTASQLKQNLNGTTYIEMQNGKFYGADLIALLKKLNENIYTAASALAKKPGLNMASSLQSLQALWEQRQNMVNPNAVTPFSSFKATFNINNGLASNSDLLISQAEYAIQGQGRIDLNNSTIDYRAAAQLKKNPHPPQDDLANYLYSSSLPINISGNFGNISVLPDVKTYANNALGFVQKNLLQKAVQQEASKVVNKIVGDNVDGNVNKAIQGTLNSILEKVK